MQWRYIWVRVQDGNRKDVSGHCIVREHGRCFAWSEGSTWCQVQTQSRGMVCKKTIYFNINTLFIYLYTIHVNMIWWKKYIYRYILVLTYTKHILLAIMFWITVVFGHVFSCRMLGSTMYIYIYIWCLFIPSLASGYQRRYEGSGLYLPLDETWCSVLLTSAKKRKDMGMCWFDVGSSRSWFLQQHEGYSSKHVINKYVWIREGIWHATTQGKLE